MRTYHEEGERSAGFVRMILKTTDLYQEDLARLINVSEATVERWLSGAPIDLGCAHAVLDLISKRPSEMIEMLSELEVHPPADLPWVTKLATIQRRLDLSKTEMVDLLNTQFPAFTKWMNQETQPSSCYQTLIDLLYLHTEKMVGFLTRPEQPEPEPWTRRRIQALLTHLGLTSTNLMDLLGMSAPAYSRWMQKAHAPGPCPTLFLNLLDRSPKPILTMIRRLQLDSPEFWPGFRVRDARQAADLTMTEISRIYGTDHETISQYERYGLPAGKGCPLLFYTLLEDRPREFLRLIADLET